MKEDTSTIIDCDDEDCIDSENAKAPFEANEEYKFEVDMKAFVDDMDQHNDQEEMLLFFSEEQSTQVNNPESMMQLI